MAAEKSGRLDKVLELVNYIHTENPDGNALAQYVTLRTFSEFGAINLFLSELKSGGLIFPTYQFGFSQEEIDSWQISNIDENIPIADALKSNSFIWLADNEDWERDYPDLVKYKIPNAQTFICWPIHIRGAYMTVIGTTFKNQVIQSQDIKNYLEIISGLVGLQISSLRKTKLSVEQDSTIWNLLNPRQHRIVSMISDGLTNYQIANELGYSQSTIRQDTIKIYEILGVAGRKGAIQAYRMNFPTHGNIDSLN